MLFLTRSVNIWGLSLPSSSKQWLPPSQVKQFDLFSRLSSAMQLKMTDFRRKLIDCMTSEENDENLLNIRSYIKSNKEIMAHYKCLEVQINGMMHESILILTPKRIEVIRKLEENGMGRMYLQRPLSQIVQITAKKRHRDLITFKYGQSDGDNLIITGELRKIALLLNLRLTSLSARRYGSILISRQLAGSHQNHFQVHSAANVKLCFYCKEIFCFKNKKHQ